MLKRSKALNDKLNSNDSFASDSDFEDELLYNQYRELVFKARLNEIDEIDSLINSFCKRWKIRKSDEISLTNYMIAIIETERIALDSREIIKKIETSFIVDQLLD